MGLFSSSSEDAIYLSREDVNEPLSASSRHSFELDGYEWPSVEHYYQAMKFEDATYRERIHQAENPVIARELGRSHDQPLRTDWDKLRNTMMTRAVYTKCKTHPQVARRLLKTGEKKLVENSQYDYYWGCGRDGRGRNAYGLILMNIRQKLREESQDAMEG